jgi:hypothetical protein
VTRGDKAFFLLLENYNNLLNIPETAGGDMLKQLPLRFEDEWRMQVINSLSEDQKESAIVALKEMLVAYLEKGSTGGLKNGECDN